MTLIVIHGQPASGKTFHAQFLRRAYRCLRILDGWKPPRSGLHATCDDGTFAAPRHGDLVLTTASADAIARALPGAQIIPIEDALIALNAVRPGAPIGLETTK